MRLRSLGKEGAECFKRLETMPESLEQWLEQLRKWGPLIVGGDVRQRTEYGSHRAFRTGGWNHSSNWRARGKDRRSGFFYDE
jgi:hypothetical protein